MEAEQDAYNDELLNGWSFPLCWQLRSSDLNLNF
jgi:hypothetical protein